MIHVEEGVALEWWLEPRRSPSGADISSKAQQSVQAAPHLTHIGPLRENVQKGPMLKKEN